MAEVNMPRVSDTMEEGTIARWLKHQGDTIKKGDILVEIETDKANMELESYDSGVLERTLVQEGETVPIGQLIAVIGSGASAQKPEQPTTSKAEAGVTQRPPARTAEIQQEGTPAQEAPASFQQEQSGNQEAGVDTQLVHVSTAPESPGPQQGGDGAMIKASPLARRMAEEYGIDLYQIKGSGPGGRIMRDDIEDFREQKQPSATTTPSTTQVPTTEAREAVQPAFVQPALPPDDQFRKLSP